MPTTMSNESQTDLRRRGRRALRRDIADFGHAVGRTLRGVRNLTAGMLLAELESLVH